MEKELKINETKEEKEKIVKVKEEKEKEEKEIQEKDKNEIIEGSEQHKKLIVTEGKKSLTKIKQIKQLIFQENVEESNDPNVWYKLISEIDIYLITVKNKRKNQRKQNKKKMVCQ